MELKEFTMDEIQVCPNCGKVDVYKGHEKECLGSYRMAEQDNLWK